ncbi:MAG TPA: HAMP domain-containing sensor histidine kinase [Anaerolineales bacterium]|nr:HAMP domain-containing sensor histidine kinase [Anaerolineales bacterium]
MNRRWLWALVPLVLGMLFGVAFGVGLLPNTSYFVRADLAALVQVCGWIAAIGLGGWIVIRGRLSDARNRAEIKAAEDRRRFLQRLDHELKNPLTAIQAGLANIEGSGGEAPALASVKAQTSRLSRLVADLRKLADLETREIERAPVDLGEILETLVELARTRPSSAEKRITLSVPQAPWPLPRVPGDYDLLLLALHNLLDNALKFSRKGDTIEIRAFEDGQSVVVEVADTGPGLPAAELPHVWDELYRGVGARGVPGSGLGLALVRAIVERHGGAVSVRSREGQGTVVGVRLQV